MSKHTPGPWEWVGNELWGADSATVLEVRDLPEMAYPELQSGSLVMPNEEHDRPLIAAAPEMYEALKWIAECGTDLHSIRKAQSAIANAKGSEA